MASNKTRLKNAVAHLKSVGEITRDKDIVDRTGLSKSYVSAQLKAERPAMEFINKFEEAFKVPLNLFDKAKPPVIKLLSDEEWQSFDVSYLRKIEAYQLWIINHLCHHDPVKFAAALAEIQQGLVAELDQAAAGNVTATNRG